MRGKKILIILLTVLVFLSAATLGISTVFRVDEVTVIAPVVSEEAKAEASDLQNRLQKAYEKKNTIFLDSELADKIIEDFPYFRITTFEKDYPNRIVVTVSEDEEVYAVQKGEEYYILNSSGVLLGIRKDYVNRSDENNNLLITGNNLTVSGEKGAILESDVAFSSLYAFCGRLSERLLALPAESVPRGLRGNILSVEIQRPVVCEEETVFKLTTVEGVCIYVRNPAGYETEMADKAIDKYLSLSDLEKTTGMVVVWKNTDGVKTDYYKDTDIID